MGNIATLRANDLLDVAFGGIANPFPANYYLALSSTQPTNIGGNVTEPVGGDYARVMFANNTTTFPGAGARETTIDITIAFPEATANWGDELGWFAIYDHATASLEANFVGWGALGTPVTVITGGIVTFPPGSLVINVPA